MASTRAVVSIFLFMTWTMALLPVQALAVQLRWRQMAEAVPMLYHRGLARILRLRVRRVGTASRDRPTLFVFNHVSWLDIVVIDTLFPGCFVAKSDVASWPVFGLLAKLQRTVFVERRASRSADSRDEMSVRLENGDNLILFPEGTSSDGLRVLPFKSTFFALAEREVKNRPLKVQPVSISYCRLNGLPVGRTWAGNFAWIGDQDLASHLWQFLKSGPSEVVVQFHDAVTIQDFGSRKALSAHCQTVVAQGVSDALAARASWAPGHGPKASGNPLSGRRQARFRRFRRRKLAPRRAGAATRGPGDLPADDPAAGLASAAGQAASRTAPPGDGRPAG